jgi:hypothetical protein
MPNSPKAGTVQITMRVSEELAERAEQMAKTLREEHPGIPIARTDAMRMVLEKHLPPLRGASGVPGPGDNKPPGPGTNRAPGASEATTKARAPKGSGGPAKR